MKKVDEVIVLRNIVEGLKEKGVTKYELINAVASMYTGSDKLLSGLDKIYSENPEAKGWTINEKFKKILKLESNIFRPVGEKYFCELLGKNEIKLIMSNNDTLDSTFNMFYMFEDVKCFEFFRNIEEAKSICFTD